MGNESEARESLFEGQKSKREYGSTPTDDDQVERIITEQDAQLDHLSHGVKGVRDVALQIHDEVDSQLQLIDSVDASVSRSAQNTSNATSRVREAPRSVYNIRTFCILLWPLVLLIVMVAEGIIHFIF